MKLYTNIEQGSGDWFRLRLGIPTASCFDQIITPKKCELSKSASKYALRLVAERLLNMPTDTVEGMQWMERGQEMEPVAVDQYEFVEEVKTRKVAFITTDDGSMGCSPDRIVLDDERRIGLEIKCPSPAVHLGYLLQGVADEYKPQVQGQIMIAELHHNDLYSYHPQCPPALIRTLPDLEYIAKMRDALLQFNELLANLTERAKSMGVFQAMQHAASPLEIRAAMESRHALDAETMDKFSRYGFAN